MVRATQNLYQKQFETSVNNFISNRVYINQLQALNRSIYTASIVPPQGNVIEIVNQKEEPLESKTIQQQG